MWPKSGSIVVCLNVSRRSSILCWKKRKLSKRVPSFILNVGRSVIPVSASSCPKINFLLVRRAHFFGPLSTLFLVYLILSRRTQPYSSSTPTNVYWGGRQGIFHTFPLRRFPLKRIFIVCLLKLRGFLKRWGVLLIHFQYLVSKTRSEKGRERVSYIDFARPWIFDAHGVFPGDSYEIAWRFWGLSLSNLCVPNYRKPPARMG